MKICSACGVEKPLSEYSPRNDRPCGVQAKCKECKKLEARQIRAALGDTYNAYKRSWYHKNAAKEIARNRVYKEQNRDQELKRGREYIKKNRARYTAHQLKRMASQINATPTWSNEQDIAMWYEVANVLSRSGVKFVVDHIVPLRGKTVCGLHDSGNMQILPWHKNAAKSNRHWPDMPL